MALGVPSWTLLLALLALALGLRIEDSEEEVNYVDVAQTALTELLITPVSRYGDLAHTTLRAVGLKDTTIQLLKTFFQGLLSLLRPVVRPIFRVAGAALVAIHVFRSVLPHPLNTFLPKASTMSGILGDLAADLGLEALAHELHMINFAGPQYSPTWVSWMESCHSRALCDLGHYVAHELPILVPFVDIIGPPLGFTGDILTDLKSGLQRDSSCGDIFVNCPHMTEIYTTY